MFGYGFLAVVLVLYLAAIGLDPLGDRGRPDPDPHRRHGRSRCGSRPTPTGSAAGACWSPARSSWSSPGSSSRSTSFVPLLILAGAIGVISPTGNEVGPFLAVEQAAPDPDRPATGAGRATFAWYNVAGYVATATGALGGGAAQPALLRRRARAGRRLPRGGHRLRAHRHRAWPSAPGDSARRSRRRRRRSRRRDPPPSRARPIEGRRAEAVGLFSLDAFGGGFIPQSLMAYWFHLQFGVEPGAARRDLLRGEPAGRRSRRCRPLGSPRGSGSSTRWSSPTCRRTCC